MTIWQKILSPMGLNCAVLLIVSIVLIVTGIDTQDVFRIWTGVGRILFSIFLTMVLWVSD